MTSHVQREWWWECLLVWKMKGWWKEGFEENSLHPTWWCLGLPLTHHHHARHATPLLSALVPKMDLVIDSGPQASWCSCSFPTVWHDLQTFGGWVAVASGAQVISQKGWSLQPTLTLWGHRLQMVIAGCCFAHLFFITLTGSCLTTCFMLLRFFRARCFRSKKCCNV